MWLAYWQTRGELGSGQVKIRSCRGSVKKDSVGRTTYNTQTTGGFWLEESAMFVVGCLIHNMRLQQKGKAEKVVSMGSTWSVAGSQSNVREERL